jgi:hypothetical protein
MSEEAFEDEAHWEQANHAATALQCYYDESRGIDYPLGDSYGDEGSDEMVRALLGLLVDLRHLTFRCGLDFPDINDVASEEWCRQISDDEEEAQ